jgi:NAD(P)-dependent dehydrogenase (short-subunit alcohol dehydrogenase family)
MTSLRGKQALVVGGTSGIGKATVNALLAEGARVTVVARHESSSTPEVSQLTGDATQPELAANVMRELKPDLLVFTAGVTPTMGPLDALDWATFSEAWNVDVQAAFHFVKAALQQPLAPGSSVVLVSSGAALNGSPRSGGYAGAKRMQWWLAEYAQRVSDAKQLGLRVLAVLPDQLVEGTTIGERAATVYGAQAGLSAAAFMKRFEAPLDVDTVAAAVLGALRGEVATGVKAIAVRGAQTRALP